MNKIVIILILVGIIGIIVGCGVYLGVAVYKANQLEKNTKFPPWPAKCPDYWTVVDSSDSKEDPGVTCKNIHGLGLCKTSPSDNDMKFYGSQWKGAKGMKYKCNWAKACEVPWEGVDSIC